MDQLPNECVVVTGSPCDWSAPTDTGIVITHQHYRWEELSALRRVFEQHRIPTLVLADGILDYRNTWEHPDLPDGSMFQPLIANKIACIGNGQARLIESWGNRGCCEVIGLPRLDQTVARPIPAINPDGPLRLLVATATTPAFNDPQRRVVIRALACIKDRFEADPTVCGRPIELTWRLTDGLDTEIGLPAHGQVDDLPPLSSVIDASDAVITTPSTLYLESILRKRPTAILDFMNSPKYVPSVWTISAPEHLDPTLLELASPAGPKMQFQDFILHDQLECSTPATGRMIRLIQAMIDAGLAARQNNQPLRLPAQIIWPDHHEPSRAHRFGLEDLYPENEVFKLREVAVLQIELSQAIKRLESMPRELSEKNEQITQLQSALDESRRRVADLRARLFKLRRILGIGKNEPE
jgi:hypothetical protein